MSESPTSSDYPGALDSWVTLTDKEDLAEVSDINKIKAAILAIQTELGLDPAGSLTNLKTRLAAAIANDGAIAKGTSFPTNPVPVEGQMFYRTDENTFYVYDGSSWETVGTSGSEIFTANGTFTVPGGVTKVYLTMVGGGGGGGGCPGGGAGGGGASGVVLINYPFTVTPAADLTVTIGAAGAGGAAGDNEGVVGGDTSFDSVTVAGGNFGRKGSVGTGGAGTSMVGGNVTAGTLGESNSGGDGTPYGGGGGGCMLGAGGIGGTSANGSDATGNGGGGGGGQHGSVTKAGGAGTVGICIVMY